MRRIVVFGKTGCGKTWLIQKELMKSESRVLIWDYCQEYMEVAFHTTNLKDILDAKVLSGRSWKMAYTVQNESDAVSHFDLMCELALKLEDCLVICEEADSICSPNKIGNAFGRLIRLGRHHNISWIITTKRPPEIHRLITGNALQWYVFKTTEPIDVKYFRDSGLPIEKLARLKRYQYYLHEVS